MTHATGRGRFMALVTGLVLLLVIAMLALGGLSTSIAYWLWGRLLRDYPPAQVVPFALLVPVTELTPPKDGEKVEIRDVRFRTVGDMTCTAAVSSDACTVEDVIAEISATRITERGASRADDKTSEAAMEDRKREGYF